MRLDEFATSQKLSDMLVSWWTHTSSLNMQILQLAGIATSLYATLVLQRTELHEDPKTPTALTGSYRILQDLTAQTVGTDLEPKQSQTPRIPIPKSSPKTIVAPIIPPDSAKCRAETLLAGDR